MLFKYILNLVLCENAIIISYCRDSGNHHFHMILMITSLILFVTSQLVIVACGYPDDPG